LPKSGEIRRKLAEFAEIGKIRRKLAKLAEKW
jgi:hypothetical protein